MRRKKSFVRTLERRLQEAYGSPPKRTRSDPIDVLIQTILSQNTSDVNSHRAFDSLRERFSSWDAVRVAPLRSIERAIRIGGLAQTKAWRIKRILSRIHTERGRLTLGYLCTMDSSEAAAALGSFKGVGPKTANCVLLFGCGMDAFPVDTHILRISKRLGLIPESATLERAHKLWAGFLPTGCAYSLHLNLIAHGRQICHSRTPRCPSCCLRRMCAYYSRSAGGGEARSRS